MTINSNKPQNVWNTQEPTNKTSWFMWKLAEYKKIVTWTALLGVVWLWELPKQDANHQQEPIWITQTVETAKNKASELLVEIKHFSQTEASASTLEDIDPKNNVNSKINPKVIANISVINSLLLRKKDTIPDAFTFTDKTNVELNTRIESTPLTVKWIEKPSQMTIVWGEYSINWWPWTTVPVLIKDKQNFKVRHMSGNNYATDENTTVTIGWKEWKSDTFTSTTLDIIPDLTAPTINNLPTWGTEVPSGSTTANTVNMVDESAWWDLSNISITADNWGTISWLDTTSYGDKPFNFIAPVGPVDVTITYSITDAGGNVTTTTQVVSVAASEGGSNQAPVALDGSVDALWNWWTNYDLSDLISDDKTLDNMMTISIVNNPDNLVISWWISGTVAWQPGFTWNSYFEYKACDEEDACDIWKMDVKDISN